MPYPVLPPAPPPIVSTLPEGSEPSTNIQVADATVEVEHPADASATVVSPTVDRFPPERSPSSTSSAPPSESPQPGAEPGASSSAVLGPSLRATYETSPVGRALAAGTSLPPEFAVAPLATPLASSLGGPLTIRAATAGDRPSSPSRPVALPALPPPTDGIVYSTAPLPILDQLTGGSLWPPVQLSQGPDEAAPQPAPGPLIDTVPVTGQQILVIPPPGQSDLAPPLEDADAPAPGDAVSGDEIEASEDPNPPAAEAEPGTEEGAIAPEPLPDIVELRADRQDYDTLRRIVTAEGNAVLQYQQGVVAADRLQINLDNRTALAEGDAVLTRGDQILRGDRFTYNFTQRQGRLFDARGEIFLPSVSDDFSTTTLPTDISADQSSSVLLTDDLIAEQPVGNITSSGGVSIGLGDDGGVGGSGRSGTRGSVRRLRFEADQIDITGENWEATNVRITNDPFSPPELELRSSRVRFTRLSDTRSEIRARNPRLVFDQGFSLPLLRNRIIIDERDRNPGLVQFGYDEEDRGGLYIERTFDLVNTPAVRFSVTPQLLIQRILDDNSGDFSTLSGYGLRSNLQATLDPLTTVEGVAVFNSLNPEDWEERLRASLRVNRRVGTHRLTLEYSYRDRLFNGSLGFQNVQSSLGLVLTSPSIRLGRSDILLSYQVGAQYINARTDRLDLLDADNESRRVDLGRFQVSAALTRGFYLWEGTALPATPTEGLRYTPIPIVPYLQLVTGVRATVGYYTSNDTQASLTPSIGLRGQFGHFSRDFFDYTGFNLTYSHTFREGESPFRFDRAVDRDVISFGIIQQVYGPFRVGFQTSISIDNDETISTDYILEYNRRTYSIVARYNPVREVGLLTFRINDFNWTGTPERFSGLED